VAAQKATERPPRRDSKKMLASVAAQKEVEASPAVVDAGPQKRRSVSKGRPLLLPEGG
jgi:hypothetical protein